MNKTEGRAVSPWMPDPDASHCCMRIVAGGDPRKVADRVAFIEKTPRVRVGPFAGDNHSASIEDARNWESGPKGSGGPGDPATDLTYGYDPESRAWCDQRLRELGYEIVEVAS